MSNNDDNKKKGFFSRLFGGISSVSDKKTEEKIQDVASELPSLTSLNRMKKADIVETAKNFGLDLDISLTKLKLLESWKTHFNLEDNSAEKAPAEEVKAEEAPAEEFSVEESQEEVKVEEVPAEESQEEVKVEEAPAEEAPAEEAPEEEALSEEVKAEESQEEVKAEEAPTEEAPTEEAPAEEAPEEEAPAEEVKAEEETANKVEVSLVEKSPAQIISEFENKQKKSDVPSFRPGDTVSVSVKVKEGDRTRLQAFEGIVMGIKNRGLNSSFIVRKISSGIGVERTFQLHSPLIDTIQIKRKGDVRQSKLFYLRERSGKSARIKERLD